MAETALDPATVTRDDLVASARDLAPMLRDRAEQAEKARGLVTPCRGTFQRRTFANTVPYVDV